GGRTHAGAGLQRLRPLPRRLCKTRWAMAHCKRQARPAHIDSCLCLGKQLWRKFCMNKVLDCDVLVVGSGTGGMVAALRAHDLKLNSIVIEKSDRFGGTSAVSGGCIWIPNNDAIKNEDSEEKAMDYLKACT